ncbi:STAS domain-containing protein [Virgibacillus senegalensis]|uniref:STAS domain-containing protein n=1 Tax=Virgibacillus senegalensis TaxID=1499679 RepID=UPI00069DF063|nr:STAS domain-containing protein [Virgibacillus senegalensis]
MEQTRQLAFFQNHLEKNVQQLTDTLLQKLFESFPEAYENHSEQDYETSHGLVRELISTLASLLPEQEASNQEAVKWGRKVGRLLVERNNNLSDSLAKLTVHKRVLWSFVEQVAAEDQSHEAIETMTRIDELYNHIIHGVSITLKEEEERKISSFEEKYLKTSTPIVPIMEHVAILPIIGEIDEKRAEILLEETIQKASKLSIDWLVIDLSGVVTVNDLFVSYLYKLLDLLSLLGISPILTGIQPEMSIRAMKLGMFKDKGVIAKSHLKQAVEMLHRQQN